MDSFINLDKAKEVLENGVEQAASLLKDNEKINGVLTNVQAKIKEVPVLNTLVADIPDMASMIKSYVTKEYSAVSPKVVALLVSAFLYLLRREDLVNDSIPVIGLLDDAAVTALAVKLCAPELKAYREWRSELCSVPKEEKIELHL